MLIFSANPPGTYTYVIAKHISARHWIVDCGPGIGSCMYVHHAFGMQLRLHACAMATRFVFQFAYVSACMRCSLHTWIIIYVQS